MPVSQKLKQLIPFIMLFALLGIFWRELFYNNKNELPSALIGEEVPKFKIPNLLFPNLTLTEKSLQGRVTLLNIWATWCYACGLEQKMLLKIKNQYHVPIIGIDYKDDPKKAQAWLSTNGNPYVVTASDLKGDVAIDLGVYGTPETFVISPQGKIVYRHIGVIDQKSWDEVLYPLILKYGTPHV